MLGRNIGKLVFIWSTKASRWLPAAEDVNQGIVSFADDFHC